MGGIHPAVVAVAGTWAALATACAVWVLVRVRAHVRRRREARALEAVVIDLTFFEQAVRRTEAVGRASADAQRRALSVRHPV